MDPRQHVDRPKDDVPDDATILRRVPDHLYEDDGSGRPKPGAFTNLGKGMSSEWERGDTTPEVCRGRAPTPETHGVVELNVGAIRPIEAPKQTVEHTWSKRIHNHVDVFGDKDLRAQTALVEMSAERIAAPNKAALLSSKKP